ncbi:hypothetical protein [Acidilobus sp.]|uniref:hypothetical protein n=1 Tax=Acidilobus sp. TaxID=1872109 RepID=UPI003CFFB5FC
MEASAMRVRMSVRLLYLALAVGIAAFALTGLQAAACSQHYTMIPRGNYTLLTLAGVNNYNAYIGGLQDGAAAMISPMLWNLVGGSGNVTMVLSGGHLYVYINVTGVSRAIKFTPVVGFPDIMYGWYSWGPFYTRTSSYGFLSLPMPASEVPDLWSVVNYSLSLSRGAYNDFSYDIWLVRSPGATSLGPSDVELMLWMYANQSLAGLPYWVTWRPVTMPTLINGTIKNVTYQVFILPRNGGPSGWMLIILIPEVNESGGQYHGLLKGEYGVDLGELMNETLNIIGEFNGTQWEQGLYLSVIQLGAEVDAPGGDMMMNFNVSSWYLVNGSPTNLCSATTTTTSATASQLTSTTSVSAPAASTSHATTSISSVRPAKAHEVEELLVPVVVAVVALIAALALLTKRR